jgi:hypothetical protein
MIFLEECARQIDRIGLTKVVRCLAEYIKTGSSNNAANSCAVDLIISPKVSNKVIMGLTKRRDSRKCRQ